MLAQVPLIVGSVGFFAVNLYLWSLPIRQEVLFLIATPIGIIYFAGFFWYVVRTTTPPPPLAPPPHKPDSSS
jgi:hypothetical protein